MSKAKTRQRPGLNLGSVESVGKDVGALIFSYVDNSALVSHVSGRMTTQFEQRHGAMDGVHMSRARKALVQQGGELDVAFQRASKLDTLTERLRQTQTMLQQQLAKEVEHEHDRQARMAAEADAGEAFMRQKLGEWAQERDDVKAMFMEQTQLLHRKHERGSEAEGGSSPSSVGLVRRESTPILFDDLLVSSTSSVSITEEEEDNGESDDDAGDDDITGKQSGNDEEDEDEDEDDDAVEEEEEGEGAVARELSFKNDDG